MEIRQQFVEEVDGCLDQAVAEGWVVTRGTSATIAVTFGVLITRFEMMDDGAMLAQAKHLLRAALDYVA